MADTKRQRADTFGCSSPQSACPKCSQPEDPARQPKCTHRGSRTAELSKSATWILGHALSLGPGLGLQSMPCPADSIALKSLNSPLCYPNSVGSGSWFAVVLRYVVFGFVWVAVS